MCWAGPAGLGQRVLLCWLRAPGDPWWALKSGDLSGYGEDYGFLGDSGYQGASVTQVSGAVGMESGRSACGGLTANSQKSDFPSDFPVVGDAAGRLEWWAVCVPCMHLCVYY